MRARTVVWFRRDLRLADHPALAAAASDGDVVALFVLDPAFDRAGSPRRDFLTQCLHDLGTATHGALVCRRGDPVSVVPAVAAEAGAASVHVTADAGPYGRRRDAAVARALANDGRHLVASSWPYAVAPGAIRKADGTPYTVFTPFLRAWLRADPGPPSGPADVRWSHSIAGDDLPAGRAVHHEAAAHDRLDRFLADSADRYDADRDRPAADGTSRLSPYLRWGSLHPRQLLDRLGGSRAHAVFRSELAWREFYADVLWHRPRAAWWNIDERMDAMAVDAGAAARRRFERWAAGRTGYPFVDAGLRQLEATGWMHNRARMVTGSFLVKDLHLPWQWGARHFLRHLVDGDLASNNLGWQWVAGTGTDAAPYFRVFNPITQSKRFDPDGDYIRRWVPELRDADTRSLHAPWEAPGGPPDGYPGPMVDHAEERAEALRRYGALPRRS